MKPQAHRMERALAAARKAANRDFDLARDPMLRAVAREVGRKRSHAGSDHAIISRPMDGRPVY